MKKKTVGITTATIAAFFVVGGSSEVGAGTVSDSERSDEIDIELDTTFTVTRVDQ